MRHDISLLSVIISLKSYMAQVNIKRKHLWSECLLHEMSLTKYIVKQSPVLGHDVWQLWRWKNGYKNSLTLLFY